MTLNESTYENLERAFAPLEEANLVKYFGEFECCGTCAAYAIKSENWGPYKGLIMFNEQRKAGADETGELDLTACGFEEADDDDTMRLVGKALLDAGFKLADPDKVDYHRNFEPNVFFPIENGYRVWGNFFTDDREDPFARDEDDEDDD